MNHSEFLQQFHKLQLGITYKELFPFPFGSLCYSVETEDPSENHCLSDRNLTGQEISEVEKKFAELERIPSFYFDTELEQEGLGTTLRSLGYSDSWQDAWLFYNLPSVELPADMTSLIVSNSQELEIFLSTLSRCFQENDPQNPHGSLDERLENTGQIWETHQGTGRLEYYVFYLNGLPVATSALTSLNAIGYIDAVGSLREVRGKGFGKNATLFAVKESMKKQNTVHCLCTIEGTYPHEFYKRLGFEHTFSASGVVKTS